MKITAKTVAIVSSVVVVVVTGFLYYSSTRDTPEVLSWMNSNWLYRRSISVTNAGSTLTNEDVLIEYDTASLVTAGKLQSDCDDLRFVDSDDSTALAYWVEGGCNSSTTHIWVRIPSLTSGGKTIYMYYGNSSATNAEETWTGKFYLMKTSACDSGWTTESNSGGDFYLKYPYPASTFGTTGGSSSHNHGSYNLTTSDLTSGSNTTELAGNSIADNPHNHSVTIPTETNSSVLPPYLDMLFCSNNDLVIKQNTVTEFDTTAPTGFTQFSALDSTFPRGNTSYSGTQAGATTHTHVTTQATTGGASASTTCDTGTIAADPPTDTSTHTFAVDVTSTGDNVPSYMTVIYGQAGADIMAPAATIVMSNATPPLGWSRFSALDGYFPYGATSYGTTGGNATHTHGISLTSGNESATIGCTTKTNPKVALPRTHTHTVSTTTSTYSNNPPYISALFIQKKTSQTVTINNEDVPNVAPNAPTSLLTEGATNPIKVTDLTPEFSAIYSDPDSDNGIYYEIEVNTQSDFLGTSMWDTGKLSTGPITTGNRSSDFSYAGSTLTLNGTTYYWRMRFWDAEDAISNWSSTAQFIMSGAPLAPSSLLAEGSTNPTGVTDLTPEFSAIHSDPNSDSTASYEIEVNTLSNFAGTVMWDSNQTAITIANNARSSDISYNGTALSLNGSTYYWRIRFWDTDSNVSNWSSTAQFTMYSNTTPNAPSTLYTETTSNPIKVTDLTPEFSAVFSDSNGSDTGNYYEIEVNTNNTFTGTVMWDTGQTAITPITNGARSSDISYAGTALTLNGTTYYWRMKFWDNYEGESSWSSTAQFTMSGVPFAPSSLLTEGSTNPTGVGDLTPEFSAIHTDPNTDSTSSYEIELNSNNTFTGTVMWDTGQQAITIAHNARSSDISYAGTALAPDGSTYYWRIRFWDTDSNVSSWSSTAQFTLTTNVAPNDPSSSYTETSSNPTKVTDTTPEFSAIFTDANGSDTGIYYEIDVNTNNTFTGTVMWASGKISISPITNGTRSSDISYAGTALTADGITYYWRIRFWDNYDTVSNWSVTSQFTMSGVPYAPSSLYTEGTTNPASVTDITPEFSAIHTDPNGDSTTHYEIEVNTQSDFLGTSMWDSNQTVITVAHNARSADIPYAGTTLTLNSLTYYWRIRFWDSVSDVGPWSSVASFTMTTNITPNAPSSLYTETTSSPAKVTDVTPEFSAIFSDSNGSDTGNYYEIEVNTNNTFTGTVMWHSNQTAITPITNGNRSSDISYNGTALTLDGLICYWRIKFWDSNGGESSWSSTAQFQMSGAPIAPSGVKVDRMTNPTQLFTITPEFSALHSDPNGDNAVYYEIEVNSLSNFTGTTMWDTNKVAMTSTPNGQYIPDILYAGTALTGDSSIVYYWRIRLWDTDDLVSEWSTTAFFTDFVQEEQYIQMEGVLLERLKIN